MVSWLLRIFLLLAYTGHVTPQQCGDECTCPDAWTYFRGSCYLFADNVKYSWAEAAHFCELHHAHLVVIDNRPENMFLQDHSLKLFKNAQDRHNSEPSFWTAASDETIEGLWTWYTDGSDLSYLNWSPGQPDRHLGHDEDCMILYGYYNFTWHDDLCTDQCFPLCELQLSEKAVDIVG